jgi:hypothetical protein
VAPDHAVSVQSDEHWAAVDEAAGEGLLEVDASMIACPPVILSSRSAGSAKPGLAQPPVHVPAVNVWGQEPQRVAARQ